MKKYLLSIICTLLPIFASAQEPYVILIDDGTALEFRYDNNRESYPDAMYVGSWSMPKESIYSVVFNESFANCTSITSLSSLFSGFTNLETIIGIEYLNTSNVTSMSNMFRECSALTSLDLSHFDTSNVIYGMNMMFYGCSNLTSLDVSHFDTSNVPSMRAMFSGCSSLTSLDVSHFDTSNVTDMAGMFNDCSNLTSLDVSNFNTSNVVNMTEIFSNCSNLSSLDVRYFDTSNVTDMPYMFNGCSGLSSLDVSNFNTSSALSTGNMFAGCSSLTSLDIRSFNTPNLLYTYSMFDGCSNLTTIYADDGWNIDKVTKSENMFRNCSSLVGGAGTTYDSGHIDASYAHVDGGSSNPGYFTGEGGGSGEEAQYWKELESTLQYADDLYGRARDNSNVEPWMLEELSNFMNRGSDMLDAHEADEQEVRHMIEEINYICWEIEEAMNRQPEPSEGPQPYAIFIDNNTALEFRYDDQWSAYREAMMIYPFSSTVDRGWNDMAESIHSVVFNESFANCTTITSTEYWFFGCSNLETFIGLENLNTSNVTNMASMFHGCSSLTSLDLSSFNTTSVTEMKMMFYECPNLTTIYVSSGWSTANVSSSDYMFGGSERIVGGRGTQWNPDYTDAAYAHIDGGIDNPGYLTDINGSGTSDLDQRRADLLDRINQLMQEADVCHMLLDQKDPQRTSDLWNQLANIEVYIMDVRDRTERAESDAELDECEDMIQRISEDLAWLRMKIDDYEIVEGEAYFDGLTAWVYGDATLDDAFAEVGRESAVQTIAAIVWEGTGALTAEQMQGITNPNLLVYVTEASKAPAGVQNVIVNGTAAQIVLTDASGNNNFFCPEPFTAQSISYTRNFSQTTEIGVSRGWETIALPFNVQSISHGSHGALVPFGGGNGGYPFWLHQLQDNGLTPVTAMEANTPYLICMPNNTVYPSAYNQAGSVTFASSNVTVPRTEPREAFGANVILMPAFQNQPAGPDIFTLNVGAARDSYAEGSVFISNYSDVRPFQAYVHHSNQARGTDEIQYIPLTSIGGGDDTTAIMEIIQPAANGTGDWYSLDGRKLSSKPTQKGIYIQNGKKIVIK